MKASRLEAREILLLNVEYAFVSTVYNLCCEFVRKTKKLQSSPLEERSFDNPYGLILLGEMDWTRV